MTDLSIKVRFPSRFESTLSPSSNGYLVHRSKVGSTVTAAFCAILAGEKDKV